MSTNSTVPEWPVFRKVLCAKLGERQGAIAFDPSSFEMPGQESVGVARQCWQLGKIDNCLVGVDMESVSSQGHVPRLAGCGD